MRGVRRTAGAGNHGNGAGSGGGGGGQGRKQRPGFGSTDSYILDPLLLPRLEQYSHNNQVSNIDTTVDYLRTNYREYRRKQQGPFRKLVVKAVNILRKRTRDNGGESDDDWERRPRGIGRRDGDEILQAREEQHIMRFRSGAGRRNDELEAESLDNSSENSDGVESEGMSEGPGGAGGDERERPVLERGGGGRANGREPTGKLPMAQKRKLVIPRRAFHRREGKENKDTSDSDEEELAFDGMDEEKPGFNLLNSSLRATYNGRPTLVIESSSAVDKNGYPGGASSSLLKLSAAPKVYENGETSHAHGESSRAAVGSSSNAVDEEDLKPAFAPPSVVAEAARAALLGKRSRKGLVIDQETRDASARGATNVTITDRELHRGSPPAQSSGRPPQVQKLNWQFQSPSRSGLFTTGGNRLRVEPQLSSEARVREEHQVLERKENDVRPHDGAAHVAVKYTDRENGKGKGSKRRKSSNRVRQEDDGVIDTAAAGERPGSSSTSTKPKNVSFKDLGGIDGTLEIIRETIEYPLAHPELYEHLGVLPPRGVLLHGPPGCGKTMLANAIAVETGVPFLKISAPEVVSGMSGESEAKVRALFTEAARVAPCIIFIDEIDAITPKRETAQREMERRIVAQLLTCMDDLSQPLADKDGSSVASAKKKSTHVVVIGATNRPDSLDPALRRAGRFDREIALGIPDENARARILSVLARKLRLEGSFDFLQIAKRTPGFVGADLAALIKEAAAVAVKRIFISRDPRPIARSQGAYANGGHGMSKYVEHPSEDNRLFKTGGVGDPPMQGVLKGAGSWEGASVRKEVATDDGEHESWKRPWTGDEMESLSITMQDFEDAVCKVQPSAKREGFATIPDVTWDDVGSLGSVREELEFSISRPIKHPEEYQALGLDMATGVLLYGPPGCGKTLVAKAIANDAGANFISIKGPELLNKYVGESERAVRQLFTRARASAPCVLFFDEMDAMAPKRGSDGNGAAERVVNQLLTEMDGLESRRSVFIIAATNRPDMIDPALMRPGRLDKLLYVPLPDPQGRGAILKALVRTVPLAADVDVISIGESTGCEGFSGADLASLIREACIASMRERIAKSANKNLSKSSDQNALAGNTAVVTRDHFSEAFARVYPSVSSKDRLRYDMLCKQLRCVRGNIKKAEPEADDPVSSAVAAPA